MASIEKTPKGEWRARWRDPDGRSRSKTFPLRRDAAKHLAKIEASMGTGTYVDPGAGKVTFQAFAEGWRSTQIHRPGTAAQVETHFRRHVFPVLGNRPLSGIKPSEVRGLVKSLSNSLAASTIEVVFSYVSAVFNAAVAERLITESPCRGVKLPRVEKTRVVPLAHEQVRALIETVPARYRGLVILAAGTGLRQGECFGLTLDRVGFPHRTLRVDRQLVLHVGAPPHLAPPKTQASYRTIPLAQVVLDAISDHLAAFEPGPGGLVFTNDRGEPISRTRFGDVWRKAVREAGLPEGTGFHELRHYYASVLIRSGASIKVVQERLGHASAVETLDTYAHLFEDEEDRSRQAVEDALGPLVSPPCHEEGCEDASG